MHLNVAATKRACWEFGIYEDIQYTQQTLHSLVDVGCATRIHLRRTYGIMQTANGIHSVKHCVILANVARI